MNRIILLICFLAFVSMVYLIAVKLFTFERKAKSHVYIKNICLAMQDYASSDIRFNRMPYPSSGAKLTLTKWGESLSSWSPEVAKLLFKSNLLNPGDEYMLSSTGEAIGEYEPMTLSEDIDAIINKSEVRWKSGTKLDYHLYCEPYLTNKISGSTIIAITYDNPKIKNCLFRGDGWVVFKMDGTNSFKKRKFYGEYDFGKTDNISLDAMAKTKGLKAMQVIDPKATLKKVFGTKGNGGSTEIIGSRTSSAVYKAFVEE